MKYAYYTLAAVFCLLMVPTCQAQGPVVPQPADSGGMVDLLTSFTWKNWPLLVIVYLLKPDAILGVLDTILVKSGLKKPQPETVPVPVEVLRTKQAADRDPLQLVTELLRVSQAQRLGAEEEIQACLAKIVAGQGKQSKQD